MIHTCIKEFDSMYIVPDIKWFMSAVICSSMLAGNSHSGYIGLNVLLQQDDLQYESSQNCEHFGKYEYDL